jgi:hypothetical protein
MSHSESRRKKKWLQLALPYKVLNKLNKIYICTFPDAKNFLCVSYTIYAQTLNTIGGGSEMVTRVQKQTG